MIGGKFTMMIWNVLVSIDDKREFRDERKKEENSTASVPVAPQQLQSL